MTPPAVSEPFYWTDERWGPALRCRALDRLVSHFFTTRHLGLSSAGDWQQVADAVGSSAVVTLEQVHGRAVVVIRRDEALPAGRPTADVVVSDRPGVALAVRAADCVPLLMADERVGAVAAVHAGWRGTAVSAAVAGVDAMREAFGSRPDDIVAVIGPCIGACCYEVGTELVDAFAAAGHPRHLIDRWFIGQPPPRGRFRPAVGAVEAPKLRLDVAGANRDQLMLAGVPGERIHMAGLCTAMHPEVLTSFRVEREKAGRLAGVIRARS